VLLVIVNLLGIVVVLTDIAVVVVVVITIIVAVNGAVFVGKIVGVADWL
jgi:hypothetical protein